MAESDPLAIKLKDVAHTICGAPECDENSEQCNHCKVLHFASEICEKIGAAELLTVVEASNGIIIGQEAICPDGLGRVVAFEPRFPSQWVQVETYVNNRGCKWAPENVTLINPITHATVSAALSVGPGHPTR